MMILLPIGTERALRNGLPLVTLLMLSVCVGVFLLTYPKMERDQAEIANARTNFARQWVAEPWLVVQPRMIPKNDRLGEYVAQAKGVRQQYYAAPEAAREWLERHRKLARVKSRGLTQVSSANPFATPDTLKMAIFSGLDSSSEAQLEEQQARLDAFADEVVSLTAGTVSQRWGYVAKQERWITLITSAFLHGGWLHLIFNMLFLVSAMASLEDLWGRGMALALYLVSAAGAALFYTMMVPDSYDTPLIGASGAVAGLMGAFTVRLHREHVRFFYALLVRVKVFYASAGLVAPLWVLGQVFDAIFFTEVSQVAYWAHLGGFAVGMIFARVVHVSDFERRVRGYDREVEEERDRFRPEKALQLMKEEGRGSMMQRQAQEREAFLNGPFPHDLRDPEILSRDIHDVSGLQDPKSGAEVVATPLNRTSAPPLAAPPSAAAPEEVAAPSAAMGSSVDEEFGSADTSDPMDLSELVDVVWSPLDELVEQRVEEESSTFDLHIAALDDVPPAWEADPVVGRALEAGPTLAQMGLDELVEPEPVAPEVIREALETASSENGRAPDHVLSFGASQSPRTPDRRRKSAALDQANDTEIATPRQLLDAAIMRGDHLEMVSLYASLCSLGTRPALTVDQELVLAGALERAGLILEAAKACRRAEGLEPKGHRAPEAVFNAARLLMLKLDRPDAGRALLKQLRARWPESGFARQAKVLLRKR